MATLYVIEVEKGESELDLFYSSTGILVKIVVDTGHEEDYDDYLPHGTVPMYGRTKSFFILTKKGFRKNVPVFRRIISVQRDSFGATRFILGKITNHRATNGG